MTDIAVAIMAVGFSFVSVYGAVESNGLYGGIGWGIAAFVCFLPLFLSI